MKEIIPTVDILNIPFSVMGMDETVRCCENFIRSGRSHQIITANPEIVMMAQQDSKLMQILHNADIVTCDGTGIVWATKFTDFSAKERVAGFDLTLRLLSLCQDKGFSVYFVGAKPEIMESAVAKITERWPQLEIKGYHHGYFRVGDEQRICQDIIDKKPSVLFVALGAPRQEYWIAEHLSELGVSLAIGVGGSFDVLSGKVKRAPVMWQKLHLEWLYRLLLQPSRWRRMLALPKFVYYVLRNQKTAGNFVEK